MTLETEDGPAYEEVAAAVACRQAALRISKQVLCAMPLFQAKVCCERELLSSCQKEAIAGLETNLIRAAFSAKLALALLHKIEG